MKKTFKIIVKLGTLSLPSGAVVFFGGDRLRQPRDGTMLDETPGAEASQCAMRNSACFPSRDQGKAAKNVGDGDDVEDRIRHGREINQLGLRMGCV